MDTEISLMGHVGNCSSSICKESIQSFSTILTVWNLANNQLYTRDSIYLLLFWNRECYASVTYINKSNWKVGEMKAISEHHDPWIIVLWITVLWGIVQKNQMIWAIFPICFWHTSSILSHSVILSSELHCNKTDKHGCSSLLKLTHTGKFHYT